MQPLKIFIVHPSDMITDHLPNGAGWIVYNYLKGLTERGHAVHVAAPRVEMRGPVPHGMHLYPIQKRTGAMGRLSYMWAVRSLLRRLSRSMHFDIVQQFTPVESGLSLCVLNLGIPLVLGPYSGHWAEDSFGVPKRSSVASKIKRHIRDAIAWIQQKQARGLIITCPAAIERITSRSMRDTRVHVISHGIDCQVYGEREEIPEKSSILFLANLEYWKGIFTLLEAFESVAQAMPECSLEIWGDGAEAAAVEQRIRQSRFQDRIHLRGRAPRDKVGEVMRSHSVYCMPSYGEPFGMTLLEAMASGVPIVTTDAGGPPYIVREGGGRVVPMRHAGRLADALLEILESADLQRSMGTFNRYRVEQEFDWSKSIDRMESVYEQVLGHNGDCCTRLEPIPAESQS